MKIENNLLKGIGNLFSPVSGNDLPEVQVWKILQRDYLLDQSIGLLRNLLQPRNLGLAIVGLGMGYGLPNCKGGQTDSSSPPSIVAEIQTDVAQKIEDFCQGGLTAPPGCASDGLPTDPQQVAEQMAGSVVLGPTIPQGYFDAVSNAVANYKTIGGIIESGRSLIIDRNNIPWDQQTQLWQQIVDQAKSNNIPIIVEIGPGDYPNPIPGTIVMGIDFASQVEQIPGENPYYLFDTLLDETTLKDSLFNNTSEVFMASPFPTYSNLYGKENNPDEEIDPRTLIPLVVGALPADVPLVVMLDPDADYNLTAFQNNPNIRSEYFDQLSVARSAYPDIRSLQQNIRSQYFDLNNPYLTPPPVFIFWNNKTK